MPTMGPSAEEALKALLTTGSPNAVAAIVGMRVHEDVLPQNVIYPAIKYQRISTARNQYRTLDGMANYASPRFQIDCWAVTKTEVLQLADAVYRLLEGFTGTVAGLRVDFISTEDEAGEKEPGVGPSGVGVFRQRLDVFMAHPE